MGRMMILGISLLCLQMGNIFAQIAPASYGATYDLSNAFIEYKLELRPDNTFVFHFFRKNYCDICEEENQFGKGTWSMNNNSLLLTIDPRTDIDEKFSLDLNDSRARLITKQNSEGIKREVLKFFDSNIFWVKSMELQKSNL